MIASFRSKTSTILLIVLLTACSFVWASGSDQFSMFHRIGTDLPEPWVEIWSPGTTTKLEGSVAIPISQDAYRLADIGLHYYGLGNMNIYLAYTPLYLVIDHVRQTTDGGDPIIYPYEMQISRTAMVPDHEIDWLTDEIYETEEVSMAILWDGDNIGVTDQTGEATIAELSILLGDDTNTPAGSYEGKIYLIWVAN